MSPASVGVSNAALDTAPVPGSPGILREISGARDLLYQLTVRDICIRYHQAVMGFGWAVFMPVLIVLVGLIVRFAMAQITGSRLELRDLGGITIKAIP